MVEDWATMCTPSNVSESAGSACISPSQHNTSFVFLFHVAGLMAVSFFMQLKDQTGLPLPGSHINGCALLSEYGSSVHNLLPRDTAGTGSSGQ